MFNLFKKDPVAKLKKQYDSKLEEALQYQRNGDIKNYSMLTQEAEKILAKIDTLEEDTNQSAN